MKNAILLLSLLITSYLCGGEIESGTYELKMNIPEMAKGKQDIILTGSLSTNKKEFTFDTRGAMGNPVLMKGMITEEGIVIWTSGEEHGGLVTFHLTGKLKKQDESTASGKVSIFQNHQRIAGGVWSLSKE
jgi:hypothetical protein